MKKPIFSDVDKLLTNDVAGGDVCICISALCSVFSACLARRKSRVRLPYSPQYTLQIKVLQ